MICTACGSNLVVLSRWEMTTAVGYQDYVDADGKTHKHDDNCRTREAQCQACGWIAVVSIRRTCWCGWKGKDSCFCHDGLKVDSWE